jgi:drug/metabolite transporter (DMT)-like permease
LTNVLLRRAAGSPDAVRAAAMFAGGVLVPGGLAAGLAAAGQVPWLPLPALDWIAGTALLGLAFIVANFALQHGASRLPAGVTSLVLLAEVVFAALSAALLGGASLETRTLTGGAMIVAAALLAALAAGTARRARD